MAKYTKRTNKRKNRRRTKRRTMRGGGWFEPDKITQMRQWVHQNIQWYGAHVKDSGEKMQSVLGVNYTPDAHPRYIGIYKKPSSSGVGTLVNAVGGLV